MLTVQTFLPYRQNDLEWTPLADGTYTRAQVFATNHPANSLANHLPRYDVNIHGVVVKDNVTIGIVVLQTPAEAELHAKQNKVVVPDPEPIPEAAKSVVVPTTVASDDEDDEDEPEPQSKNWWKENDAEVRAELLRRGLPTRGTRKERIARLEA